MTLAWTAVGAILVFEGLVFALAPRRLEDVMALLQRLSVEQRRLIGLGTLATGVGSLWLGLHFGG